MTAMPETDGPVITTDPFALLLAAHQRVEEQLSRLDAVAGTRKQRPTAPDEEVAGVVRSVLEFFAGPGARHQEAEDSVLLPRLAAIPAFAAMLPAIRAQHLMLAAELESLQVAVSRGGDDLRALAGRFAEMHRGHLIAEEKVLFPLAAHELTPAVKADLARELSDFASR